MGSKITMAERKELFDSGLRILPHWVGPNEGYEYGVLPLGGDFVRDAIAIRATERAAYNAGIRYVRKQLLVAPAGGNYV